MHLPDITEAKPEVRRYLERIGFDGSLSDPAEALARLQERHIHTVPYENLDILRGIPISLEVDALYRKIVEQRRGGYCFELNALFGWLLRELGYPVTDLFARFWREENVLPPKRRHHVLRVEAGDVSYLCDVGVGGIVPRRPIVMREGMEQQQGEEIYRLERDITFGWMLCEWKHGQWERLYSFTEEPQLPNDYVMASFWCEHAPESIFKQTRMIAMRTKEGRATVAGDEFRIFTPEGVQAFIPESKQAYNESLQRYFGLVLPD